MRPSFRLFLVSVGVLVAFGNTAFGNAEPVSKKVQSSTSTNQAKKITLPERWLQSIPDAGNRLRQDLSINATNPDLAGLTSGLVQTDKNSSVTLVSTLPSSDHSNQVVSKKPIVGKTAQVSPKTSPTKGQAVAQTSSSAKPVTDTRQAQTNNVPTLQPAQPAYPSTTTTNSTNPNDPVVEPVVKPIGPAKPGAAPEYLNPIPNPLNIPTKPEDVTLKGIQPITLQQALELAERNSPTYRSAQLQFQRSQAALQEAQAALYPTIDLSASTTRSLSASTRLSNRAAEGSTSLFDSLSVRDPLSRGFTSSATLSYDVFTSGGRPARIRAAGQQVRSDQLQVEVTREQLRLDVTNAYYDLQQADANVGIGRAAVRNSQISLRDAQALERAGIGTRFDVLRAQVQLANSQQQLTNAFSQQEVNRRQLAQILNISPAIDLAAADPVAAAGEWNLSLPDTIILAFRGRAELEQQLAQRELAQQNKKAALSALGPTLSVSAQYQIVDPFTDSLGPGTGYSVQAGLSWRIFDGGAARARANQQEANIAIAETNFENTRNQVRFQVEQAYSNLLANRSNITTARQAVEQATEALRLARLRFQAGVGTQTDVINAETDLTNAQGNLVSAVLGYNRSLATLQRAVTNLPIPTGSRTPSPVPAPPSPTLDTNSALQNTPGTSSTPSTTGTPAGGGLQTPPNTPGTTPAGSGSSTP